MESPRTHLTEPGKQDLWFTGDLQVYVNCVDMPLSEDDDDR